MDSEREWRDYIQQYHGRPHFPNRPVSVISIFRVPKFLKDTKKEAYVPQRVSLGPYHHGSAELPPMGHHKGRALCRMMKRFKANNRLVDPMDFAVSARTEIKQLEGKIRDNYEDDIDYDGETLSRMLCLDGCFLIEVLRTLRGEEDPAGEEDSAGEEESIADAENCYDPIFGKDKLSHAASDITNDILTLENQIPFIVLLKLLELELNSAVDAKKRLELLINNISGMLIPFYKTNFHGKQCSCHHHLLSFLHTVITSPTSSSQGKSVDQRKCIISIGCCCRRCISMLPCKSKARNDAEGIPHAVESRNDAEGIPHAVELRNAGIKFPHAVELRNAGIKFSPTQGGIKQIMFDENSATIYLPPICIMDRTERVFRNLIAYEMCKPSEINYVSSYAALMNGLIDREQDVALMRRMGILKHSLGSDKEVADLFNRLVKEVTVNVSMEHVFDELVPNVNAHYNNEIKVQIGQLVQEHFSSPWRALALTAASVILVLTVVQTIFTIISTYK